MAFSLQARVVFPVDRPPIEHGVVTIDDDRIASVSAKAADVNLIDLGDVALLPGLVNAHTHLEFSYLQRPLGRAGMPLVDWIRLVIQERGRNDRPDTGCVLGLSESLRLGITSIGNIATGATTVPSGQICQTHFHEVIGFSRARAESAMNALESQIGVHRRGTNAEIVDAKLGTFYGISPHSPYTVSQKLLADLVLRARQYEMPVAMHVAESQDELQLLRDGTGPLQQLLEERGMWDAQAIPRGSRPLDYLRLVAEAPRALVIHGNYLDDEEIGFLGTHAARMSLVYCPRTHSYFGHGPYPLAKMLSAGVCMALGTDSRASNPDLNLLSEMRHLAQAHPDVEPHAILQMGTLAAARALGRADTAGSIAPGKLANLVTVPLPNEQRGDASDLLSGILHDNAAVSGVWIRGSRIV